jgi:hypothetical protein
MQTGVIITLVELQLLFSCVIANVAKKMIHPYFHVFSMRLGDEDCCLLIFMHIQQY